MGCGNYLFVLSIVCQFALTAFAIRFTSSLVNQMTIVKHGRFLSIVDFLLSFLVNLCDWLTAGVSCERTTSAVKGATFNEATSVRRTASYYDTSTHGHAYPIQTNACGRSKERRTFLTCH